ISLATLQESLQKSMQEIRNQLELTLNQQSQSINVSLDKLTQATQERLREISGQVDKRLTEGFEKTTATFTDVMKRLTIIDEAQKKITELSTNVVSLQEVLSDKKTRGAFGEVQLNAIIRNVIPEAHFKLQHEFSNGKRVDCLLLLPEPTGNIAIDSKFPLETYKQLMNTAATDPARLQLEKQFKIDIRHHIQEIAKKYIIPGETSDGAVMFIPAEAIFAEIHAYHPDVIETAHQARIWLVSPTTMMAILTTARAVLKDAATRKQVHIIQEHLVMLGKDFERFQDRMDNLAKHIDQAQADVEQVHQSSKKISGRFNKIEKVDLSLDDAEALLIE
ncbi:MAG TPA: DNA recombination protein RmuC, partial [Coxiellaceae bacterium]|nr:DNA recombination protein RmuC [Coxiellaceae bacterium]